ncbi:MAG: putative competence-damage inducible protein [Planctomycetota bacterium]|nr:MAG: putative competence-damage inducible protein [Planctomycetota bacterium]
MRVVVLSVGDEILGGDILDTNARGLVQRVSARGMRCVAMACAGDTLASVEQAVRRALSDGELVLITGGLGPTRDDLTREGVAAAFELELEEHPEFLESAQGGNKKLSAGGRRQAWFPMGAQILPNAQGTAPGFVLRRERADEGESAGRGESVARGASAEHGARGGVTQRVACFPGPPNELWPMCEAWLDAEFGAVPAVGAGAMQPELRLRCCGVSESVVGELLADLMDTSDPACRVGITVSRGLLTVSVRGSDADAMGIAQRTARERLGAAVYGDGDALLPEVVVQLLTERGERVALAESCTGGLLAGAITDVAGSSAVFEQGFVTYSNAAKVEHLGVPQALLDAHGAVSEEVAAAMATGVRERTGADYGLSVTGIAGPGGGSAEKPVGTVCFGMATRDSVHTRRVAWGGDRVTVRLRSVQLALDLLRRELQGVGAG